MSHHHSHGGHATAAKRRGEQYVMCLTCGQRHHRYQAERQETAADFWPAFLVLGLLIGATYWLVLVMAAL